MAVGNYKLIKGNTQDELEVNVQTFLTANPTYFPIGSPTFDRYWTQAVTDKSS